MALGEGKLTASPLRYLVSSAPAARMYSTRPSRWRPVRPVRCAAVPSCAVDEFAASHIAEDRLAMHCEQEQKGSALLSVALRCSLGCCARVRRRRRSR